MKKEILTLQFGQSAGFLGAHFWNQQEFLFANEAKNESLVDSSVHFRVGTGIGGVETYTPRVLMYDVKGGFGSLHQNALYQEEPAIDHEIWDKKIQELKQPVIETEYENIMKKEHSESNHQNIPKLSRVETWNDFNRLYYHPRSFHEIPDYDIYGELARFNTYKKGADLFHSLNKDYILFDNSLRNFLEECDALQGIQVLSSVMDGWSGFSSQYLIELRDQLPKTSLISWAIEEPISSWESKDAFVRALVSLNKTSSLYVPLGTPAIPKAGYDANCLWRKSAVLSLGYDSITLPTRLKGPQRVSLDDIVNHLSPWSQRRISTLSLEIEDQLSAINLSWPDHTSTLYSVFSVSRGRSTTGTYNCYIDIPYKVLSSFPSCITESGSFIMPKASLSATAAPIQKIDSLIELTQQMYIGIERDELMNELELIKEVHKL